MSETPPANRIRPGSLMIRLLALFFALAAAYGSYASASRQPVGDGPGTPQEAECDAPGSLPG